MKKNIHLQIRLKDDNNISFIKEFSLNNNDWELLKNFWVGSINKFNENQIDISFELFLQKKFWLKTWKKKGFNFSIDANLKEKLETNKKIKNIFDQDCNNLIKPNSPDLTQLKLKRKLTEKQMTNISYMLSKTNMANFSVPGAGKTMTSLVVWLYLHMNKRIGKLLVIAPKSAFNAWAIEEPTEIFSDKIYTQIYDDSPINTTTQILITNYEKLENDDLLTRLKNWITNNNAMIIVDEAHRVKGGGNSVRWLACKALSELAPRTDLLTGTPMPQGYNDLRNLLLLSWTGLNPKHLTDQRLSSLKNGGIFVRTTKSQLGLPKINFKEILLEQGKIQSQIYSALKNNYAGIFKLSNSSEEFFLRRGRAVMTLIAAATNPGLITGLIEEDAYLNLKWPPEEIQKDTELYDLCKSYISKEIPEKYKWLINFLNEKKKENKKVLVWSSFVGNILSLNKHLKHFNPAIVFGRLDQKERNKQIKKFKEDPNCKVLITNPQTLGEGISLHKTCNNAVYIDRTYNAGQYLQSVDRIHRLGLDKNIITNVYLLFSKRTIDNEVNNQLIKKINRMAEMLEDRNLLVHGHLETEENFYHNFDSKDFQSLMNFLFNND